MNRHPVQHLRALVPLLLAITLSSCGLVEILRVARLVKGGRIDRKDFCETVDFTLTDKLLYVSARVGESDDHYRFVLDSYAVNVVYPTLARTNALEPFVLSGALAEQLKGTLLAPQIVKFPEITIGSLAFRNTAGFLINEEFSDPLLDYLGDGLIGANLMKNCIWQIDFQDTTLTITDDLARCRHIDRALSVPFTPHQAQRSPDVHLNGPDGLECELQFDTGSNRFLTLRTPRAAEYVAAHPAVKIFRTSSLTMDRAGRTEEISHLVLLPWVTVGSESFRNLPVEIVATEEPELVDTGTMGNAFMRHFTVTIDWPGETIYLLPQPDNPLRHTIRTFGLEYDIREGSMYVSQLYEGSQAQETGIGVGDRILAVNGYDVTALSPGEIQRFQYGRVRYAALEESTIRLSVMTEAGLTEVALEAYDLFASH